jgi:hypothetical protein
VSTIQLYNDTGFSIPGLNEESQMIPYRKSLAYKDANNFVFFLGSMTIEPAYHTKGSVFYKKLDGNPMINVNAIQDKTTQHCRMLVVDCRNTLTSFLFWTLSDK